MPIFNNARFGYIKIEKGLNVSLIEDIFNDLLDFSFIYEYDDAIKDNNILKSARLIEKLKKCNSLPYIIPVKHEKRPDKIAHEVVYGDVDYWRIIMLYNDLSDIDELYVGRHIKLPILADVEQWLSDISYEIKRSKSK